MKKIFYTFTLLASYITFSQVGIGTDKPDSSAILDLNSKNKALLITRINDVTTITIPNPVNGLMIYDKSANCIKFFQNNSWSTCLSR